MTQAHSSPGAVLWLHGLGATADDFAGLGRAIGRPELKWLLPQAPQRALTLFGGERAAAWYDLIAPWGAGERAKKADVDDICAQLLRLIQAEVPDPRRLVIGGFSQGAATAQRLVAGLPFPIAGLVAFSGYPIDLPWAPTAVSPCPALVAHGRIDDVVPLSGGRASVAALEARGHAVRWCETPSAHAVHPSQITALRGFFAEVLPPLGA